MFRHSFRFFAAATAACGLLTALAPSPAGAHIAFGPPSIEIHSDHYTQVLRYNLSTGASAVTDVFFGPAVLTLPVVKGQVEGAYLYNYAIGQFTEAYYRLDIEFPPPQ